MTQHLNDALKQMMNRLTNYRTDLTSLNQVDGVVSIFIGTAV